MDGSNPSFQFNGTILVPSGRSISFLGSKTSMSTELRVVGREVKILQTGY